MFAIYPPADQYIVYANMQIQQHFLTEFIPLSVLIVLLFLLQGNKGNAGPVGPPGMKGDGIPGPQVRGICHQK